MYGGSLVTSNYKQLCAYGRAQANCMYQYNIQLLLLIVKVVSCVRLVMNFWPYLFFFFRIMIDALNIYFFMSYFLFIKQFYGKAILSFPV